MSEELVADSESLIRDYSTAALCPQECGKSSSNLTYLPRLHDNEDTQRKYLDGECISILSAHSCIALNRSMKLLCSVLFLTHAVLKINSVPSVSRQLHRLMAVFLVARCVFRIPVLFLSGLMY